VGPTPPSQIEKFSLKMTLYQGGFHARIEAGEEGISLRSTYLYLITRRNQERGEPRRDTS
jgi:hypothetical protein